MSEDVFLKMTQNWMWGSQIADRKSNYWIGQHVYVLFYSGLELKKIQSAMSKHLVIVSHIRGGE